MTSGEPSIQQATGGQHVPVPRGLKIGAAVAAAAFVGLIGWALWVAWTAPKVAPEPPFDRFRPAFRSAMTKAGCVADFPDSPIELGQVVPSGRHSFEATFTAEEVSALLNVYRFRTVVGGSRVWLDSIDVSFPRAGRVSVSGDLVSDGSGYGASATAAARYSGGKLVSPGLDSLVVEGFTITGARRKQAGDALLEYFNEYVHEAPGLTVGSAEIVDGGVHVVGSAPQRLRWVIE